MDVQRTIQRAERWAFMMLKHMTRPMTHTENPGMVQALSKGDENCIEARYSNPDEKWPGVCGCGWEIAGPWK